ncbi:TrmH family RNA methyltransferase [Breznakia sp. PF5-3]|uniref:TrmH family RNA methyltransferase n=1 Tax=unclassified Breznakia TaxID=2623764 RepID=UPI0024070BEC|nr:MULTISPECIES: RNA methyltransferase [unclassified Breznakia]MDF9823681.1 TrmH family RNA methyltransferase [Breznakia sp. PM6-1]MDF9834479.1 TrmH family RNA methyltransferase [Breznakia sp. PF5-3]MDF9838486.1 TrmH family RNA methyltransferase [Breznakia sp. PFB2-8]MDF9859127.1 TrmH family RNA methyltransferase [Breznakia sp. PH5-24]
MKISSLQNSKIKLWMKYHQKKYRDQDQRFLIEGEHLINEAIQANCLESLLIRDGKTNPFGFANDVYEVEGFIMDKLSQNVSKVDYIGICTHPNIISTENNRLVFLDAIQDPGNMGAIIRSAYSFGYDAILVGKDCVDIYNEKTIRSTQGALFHLPIKRVDLLDEIKAYQAKGVHMIATALTNAMPLEQITFHQKQGLIFGNEGAGVKAEILAVADTITKIEMINFESLNVGVAASICMHYLRKGKA